MTKWKTGPAPTFWLELYPPSGNYHSYTVSIDSLPKESHFILRLLHLLDIIDYGDTPFSYCLRIRVK